MAKALATPLIASGAQPFLGHALHMIRRPLEFLTSLSAHGDVVRIQLGPVSAYVVCGMEAAHRMLSAPQVFDKGGLVFDRTREVLGDGLVACPRAVHRRQRRLVQPAFHRKRLPQVADIVVRKAAEEIDTWQDGDVIDVNASMFSIANRITMRALFSDVTRSDSDEASALLQDWLTGVFWQVVDPTSLAGRLPIPANRRYRHAVRRLHEIVDDIIEAYQSSETERDDLLSLLLSARDEDGDALSTTEVHDQVVTFFTGGIETTASTLAWALHFLSSRPELAHRLAHEVQAAVGGEDLGWDALRRLPLTRAVVLETLRIYPPTWLLTRIANEDAELAGYHIPAQSNLIFSPFLLHHDARLSRDTTRFAPERWLNVETLSQLRETFLPFGGGARKCIGEEFGITAITATLALLVTRFRLEPLPGKPVKPVLRTTMRPSRFVMRVHRRPA